MNQDELEAAKASGIHPVTNRIAIDAIVPIVHPANPVMDVTTEQLNLIYQGKITSWKELGGTRRRILVLSRDSSSGTYEAWENKILKRAKVTPRAQLQASNETVVQAVSRTKDSIGYVGIGFLKRTVKALKVNGITASIQTVRTGEYPISRPLFIITNGEPSGMAGEFLKFILSKEGQEIVRKEGFVPLR